MNDEIRIQNSGSAINLQECYTFIGEWSSAFYFFEVETMTEETSKYIPLHSYYNKADLDMVP